jgi:excisionase family DNA binding protein
MPDAVPPLLHTVESAAGRLSLSVSSIWRLIRSGELHPVRIRGRTLVPETELQRLARPAEEPPGESSRLLSKDESTKDSPKSTDKAKPNKAK